MYHFKYFPPQYCAGTFFAQLKVGTGAGANPETVFSGALVGPAVQSGSLIILIQTQRAFAVGLPLYFQLILALRFTVGQYTQARFESELKVGKAFAGITEARNNKNQQGCQMAMARLQMLSHLPCR